MKKIFTFICAMAIIAVYASNEVVGNNKDYDFITIQEDSLKTLSINFGDTIITGTDYHAGHYIKVFKLLAQNIPSDYNEPDTAYAYYNLQDMYGGELYDFTENTNLSDYFGELGTLDTNWIAYNIIFTQNRGGVYSTSFGIQPLDYSSCDTIIVKDEPSLKTNNFSTKLGDDIDLIAYFNTGYPFSMDSLTGNEQAKYTFYKSINDSTMVETGYTDSLKLHLKDEAHPLIAGIDSMSVHIPSPTPGLYYLKFTSDWATANKTFVLSIQDTIRVATSFDKEEYNIGTEKSAKLNVHMEYGYPYIHSKDSLPPSITLRTTIMNVKDSLYLANDSVVLASDTLATKTLNHDETLTIDLSKVTSDYLAEQHDSVFVQLEILFSGNEMYSKRILLPLKSGTTGINKVVKAVADKQSIYTIEGVKLNCSKEALRKGVYIINGKKEVVK